MKRVSTYALALSLAVAGGTTAWTAPASAQGYGGSAPASGQQLENRGNNRSENTSEQATTSGFDAGNLSDGVRAQAGAAQTALSGEAPDLAAIRTQLEGAAGAIANDDDRYFVGQMMLQLSVAMQNAGAATPAEVQAIQRRGLQYAVDSGKLPPADAGRYWTFLGNMANAEEDYPAAMTAYQNALQANPANPDALIQLANAQFRTGNSAAGYESADEALRLAREAGTEVPSTWITVPLNQASRERDAARVAHYGQQLLVVEPTPDIWSQVLLAYASAARFDDQATLDMLRLLRAAGAHNADTYQEHAALALRRGLPGEAQSVIDEAGTSGVSIASETRSDTQSRLSGDRSSLDAGRRSAESAANGVEALNTADAYASYGDYAQAVTLYRLAVEKGGIDAGTANLRLASALAASGQTSEAISLLDGVSGSREGLAKFWKVWLEQQSGGTSTPADEATSAEETAE
ncbi:MAG: tetratricopeptide repeat protein [Sphingomonadaceae bacterium]|nr:tetratricopeptide repeat protein [Sphingomonadaceae bacterium]